MSASRDCLASSAPRHRVVIIKSIGRACKCEFEQGECNQRLWRLLDRNAPPHAIHPSWCLQTNVYSCVFLVGGGGRFCRLISTFPALAHGKVGDLRSSGARGCEIMSGSEANDRLREEQEDWQVFHLLCSPANNTNASIAHKCTLRMKFTHKNWLLMNLTCALII